MPRPITRSPLIFQRFEGSGDLPQVGPIRPRTINKSGSEPLVVIHAAYVLTCIRAWPREISMKRTMIIVALWWLAF